MLWFGQGRYGGDNSYFKKVDKDALKYVYILNPQLLLFAKDLLFVRNATRFLETHIFAYS